MNPHNLDRLGDYCRTHGLAAALLSSPWTVTWLTGYAPPIQTGPSPFEGGPALAWWRDGQLVIIASDAEGGLVRAAGVEGREYAGYTIGEPLNVVERQAATLGGLLAGWSGHGAQTVGVEMRFLPAAFL